MGKEKPKPAKKTVKAKAASKANRPAKTDGLLAKLFKLGKDDK